MPPTPAEPVLGARHAIGQGRRVFSEMLGPEIDAQSFHQRIRGGIVNSGDRLAVVRQAAATQVGRADDGVFVVDHHHFRVHVGTLADAWHALGGGIAGSQHLEVPPRKNTPTLLPGIRLSGVMNCWRRNCVWNPRKVTLAWGIRMMTMRFSSFWSANTRASLISMLTRVLILDIDEPFCLGDGLEDHPECRPFAIRSER